MVLSMPVHRSVFAQAPEYFDASSVPRFLHLRLRRV